MSKVKKEIILKISQGLHARPAALLVQLVSKFESSVSISKDSEKVNAKSIMGILMLGAQQGSKLIVEIEGDDAEEAILEIENLLTKEKIDE